MTVIGNIEKAATNSTKSLDDIIGTYKRRLDRTLRATENKILDLTTRISLDAKGNVKGPKFTLAQTARIQGQLEGIFDENYGKVSRQFAGDIGGVIKIVKKVHNAVDLPIQYSKTDIKMLKNLQEQTLIGLQAFSAQTQERIAQSIQDAIIAGKPYRKLTNEIKNHITGLTDIAGRPLKQYAGVYAQDGLMNAYRSLSMQKAEEIKIKHFVWMGNVIAGTRPMCANSAGKAFTEQELQEIDLSSWAGKSCSVFACCGGWNCRHMLMPISDSYFNELKGKPIEVENWFVKNNKPIPVLDMKIINPKTYKKDMQAILTKAEINKRDILTKGVPTKPVLPVKPVAVVPKPFVPAKTVKEAEKNLNSNLIIDKGIKKKQALDVANAIAKERNNIIARYPALEKIEINNIHISRIQGASGLYDETTKTLSIRPESTSKAARKMAAKHSKLKTRGSTCLDAEGIYRHELGHAAQQQLISEDVMFAIRDESFDYVESVVAKDISKYAVTDPDEAFAEMFGLITSGQQTKFKTYQAAQKAIEEILK